MSDARRNAIKLRAASFSILVNVLLLSLKLVVGIVTGSLGMLAEVAHSLLDVIASGFAYLGVKGASIPAHEDRPYGREKYENFSSLIQTVLLGITSIWIFYEAGQRLLNGFSLEVGNALYYAMAVMVIAVVADLYVSRYLFRNARAFGSSELEADANHFSTDMYSSAAVLAGLVAAKLGYVLIDPLAAIVVAVIMLAPSIRLFRRTTRILLDAAPPKEITTTQIAEVIRTIHTLLIITTLEHGKLAAACLSMLTSMSSPTLALKRLTGSPMTSRPQLKIACRTSKTQSFTLNRGCKRGK